MTRLLVLPTLALLPGCGSLFTIHVEGSSQTTVEAATPLEVLVTDLGFGEFVSMDITSADELTNQGVEPGDVQDVRLDVFSLEALEGSADLTFLESFALFVEAPDLPRVRLTSQDGFPEGEAFVSLVTEDVDLTEYVQSQSLTLSTEVTGQRPEVETLVEARYDLTVGVTAQGVGNNL